MNYAPEAAAVLDLLTQSLPGLRPLGEEDFPQLLSLYEGNSFYNAIALDGSPTLEQCREDLFGLPPGRTLAHKLFLGLFRQKTLAACLDLVVGYPDRETLYLGLLELDQTFHRKGLGTEIVQAVWEAGKHTGFSTVRLGCYLENTPGFSFWSGEGFREEGRVERNGRILLKMLRPL